MKRSCLLSLLYILPVLISFGQKNIAGKLIDHRSGIPISFVNIGIRNSYVGTISNEDGTFFISIADTHAKDSIVFSALGYYTKEISVEAFNESERATIRLEEKVTELKTVTVSAKREKTKAFWLGNRYSKGGHIYSDSVAGGAAMALLIENKHPSYHAKLSFPVLIQTALLKISRNTFNEFKVRVRFLEVDSVTKLPGKDIFNQSVIIKSQMKEGWLAFDLSSYNLQVSQPSFYLAFEWILDDGDRLNLIRQYKEFRNQNPEKVTVDTALVRGEKVPFYSWSNFSAGTSFGVSPIAFSMKNYQCYYRNNSFGEWKRAAAILTARLLVR